MKWIDSQPTDESDVSLGQGSTAKKRKRPPSRQVEHFGKESLTAQKNGGFEYFAGWWFQTFFIFTPTWGRFPF